MKWPWTKKREQRARGLAQVRRQNRSTMPGYANDYGDFEFNKARAKRLAEQAQKEDG